MLNPGLRNSGHWKMNVQNNGLSRWAREEALGETMMSPDQWVLNKELEKTKGIGLGWRLGWDVVAGEGVRVRDGFGQTHECVVLGTYHF